MIKGILVLEGDSQQKNRLNEILKQHYWVWNISPKKMLREIAIMFCVEEDEYSEMLGELEQIAKKFDFKYRYYERYIHKMFESNKAKENNLDGDVLILHGVDADVIDKLEEFYPVFKVSLKKCSDKLCFDYSNPDKIIETINILFKEM